MQQRLSFQQRLKFEREQRGWSQAVLAEKVHSDYKTIYRWESGKSLPSPYHRQFLCELFGVNAEELGLLDKVEEQPARGQALRREDWGDAPVESFFYGRKSELEQLEQWIEDERCHVIALLGIGGIGKTALCAKIAMRVQPSFSCIFWRSLQNAPPVGPILTQALHCISGQRTDLPESFDEQLLLFLHYLRASRCLLVLDNVESIMQEGRHDSRYREGYEPYGRLLRTLGETQHQSCLLLTSREKPKELLFLDERTEAARTLYVRGIDSAEGQNILKDRGLIGSQQHWSTLVERYAGNPLALKLVSDTIQEVFEGSLARFLQEDKIVFGYIDDLVQQQFQRLSRQERTILYWLAIEREAVTLETLYDDIVEPVRTSDILTSVESLGRRFFIERQGPAQFTLQPVIMEYVTNDLVRRASQEFTWERSEIWTHYTFLKAQSKEYVRESQERLILAPLTQQLLMTFGRDELERRLKFLLDVERRHRALQHNYLASNVLKLLLHAGYDLRGADFSSLVIWQAYLQEGALQQVNFSHGHFISSQFKNTFGNILSAAVSPQDNLLAIGTATGEIWLYQVLSGMALAWLSGHTDGVWSVAFHPNGDILASSSDDQTVRLWDIATGECLRILEDHTNRVRSVTFSPNGRLLASSSDDQTVRLWDVLAGTNLGILLGHSDRIWSTAFSPDGRLLATGSNDQTIRVWDLTTGSCIKHLIGHTGWIRSVAFAPRGGLLASAGDDQTIKLWDLASGVCLKTIHDHHNRIWSMSFSPQGTQLISGSEDQSIQLHDVNTGSCLKVFHGHTRGVRAVTMTLDEQRIISGGDDQTVRFWDVTSGACVKTLYGYTNRIWSVALHPHGAMLASISEAHHICLWQVTTATCTRVMQSHSHRAKVAVFSPDRCLLTSGGEDQTVKVWNTRTMRLLQTFSGHTNWVRALAFGPDGRILASGSEDNTVRLWDIAAHRCLLVLRGHTSWIRSISFSPNGKIIASTGDDQTIRLWHAQTGECLSLWRGHTGRVRSLAFHPDGHILASGSEDHTVRVWEVTDGNCLTILGTHTNWVRTVTFSPDGTLLASAGDDQIIHLWSIISKRTEKILRGHQQRVRSVAFDHTGQILVSSSDDGTIKLWNIDEATCMQTLHTERPYEGMNITGTSGLTEAQKEAIRTLGAVEDLL